MRIYIISLALLAIGYLNNNIEVNSLKTETAEKEQFYIRRVLCTYKYKEFCRKHCFPLANEPLCYEYNYNYCTCKHAKRSHH